MPPSDIYIRPDEEIKLKSQKKLVTKTRKEIWKEKQKAFHTITLILVNRDVNIKFSWLPLEIINIIINFARAPTYFSGVENLRCRRCRELRRGRCTCIEIRQEAYDQYIAKVLYQK